MNKNSTHPPNQRLRRWTFVGISLFLVAIVTGLIFIGIVGLLNQMSPWPSLWVLLVGSGLNAVLGLVGIALAFHKRGKGLFNDVTQNRDYHWLLNLLAEALTNHLFCSIIFLPVIFGGMVLLLAVFVPERPASS